MELEPREERVLTPQSTTSRVVMQAIVRGCLQDLIFYDRSLASHRTLAAILGAILALPPVKRALANEQVRSRYVYSLIEWQERRERGSTASEVSTAH